MPRRSLALTPDALTMIDTIARSGSFAAAARELGKVPSALTYSVRQLEEALDVLLFDRRSRQAKLTAAGNELLEEARRLLAELDAVANRVRRVSSGWEGRLAIAIDDVVSRRTVFDLCEAFYALDPQGTSAPHAGGPGTRLAIRTEVMSGTWEALVAGEADLAIGVGMAAAPPPGVAIEPLGKLLFVFAVSPGHPLAAAAEPIADSMLVRHRSVAVADSAHRLAPLTVGILPGQDVLTVASMADKIDALRRGLGCGFVPEPMVRPLLRERQLVAKATLGLPREPELGYAWRCTTGPKGRRKPLGLALQWWIDQLERAKTRRALLDRQG